MSPPANLDYRDEMLFRSAEIVMIGGGIVGITAAYHMTKRDHTIAVVERGYVAGEQSSRNWGCLCEGDKCCQS